MAQRWGRGHEAGRAQLSSEHHCRAGLGVPGTTSAKGLSPTLFISQGHHETQGKGKAPCEGQRQGCGKAPGSAVDGRLESLGTLR